ncbi:MAG: CARDB domain-containing protein [Candidatus Gracilibacteria bacterium]
MKTKKSSNSKAKLVNTTSSRKSRSWLLMILLVVILGVVALAYSKGDMLKGQLLGKNQNSQVGTTGEENASPDLQAEVALVDQPKAGEDLQLRATITNFGPGFVDGKTPFKYAIEVDGDEVFSNTDSYTSMGQGDSFSFDYPVPRALYKYSDKGTIKFTVDTEDSIDEANEDNNEKEIAYSY